MIILISIYNPIYMDFHVELNRTMYFLSYRQPNTKIGTETITFLAVVVSNIII